MHTQRVQLHDLAGVVLVQLLGVALFLVEVDQHGRGMGAETQQVGKRGDSQVAER